MLSFLLALVIPLFPNPAITPGAIATTDARAVCRPGYAGAHRDVSQATKLRAYSAYGLKPSGRWATAKSGRRYWQSDYEVDHLVSLQLGGSNAPANLWPQSYRTKRWNAYAKDALENRMHWLVCHGRLSLAQAQQEIRIDWRAAYDKYITYGPPKGTK